MHDLGQVKLEGSGLGELEYEDEFESQFELEDEGEDFLELEDEDELGETAELELASQFLEIGSEQELEQFLGNVIRRAAGAVSDFARTREGRQIGGILKHAAGRVLPVLGRAAGRAAGQALAGVTGGSRQRYGRTGAQLGTSVGNLAKKCFGLELEGISHEDQEFEVARQFVRFAGEAVRNCLRRMGTGPAGQVARQAAVDAGRQLAPGLINEKVLAAARVPRSSPAAVRPAGGRTGGGRSNGTAGCSCGGSGAAALPRAGRWELRGNTIVLSPR